MSALPIAAELDTSSEACPAVVARRLKLLIITDTSILATGGSERFLRNLLSRLPGELYDITVVQLAAPPHPAITVTPLVDAGSVRLKVLPVDAAYGRRGRTALRELRRMVRTEHYDIVQSQHEKSDLFNALLPRRAGTFHVSNRRDMGFNKSPRLRWAFRMLRRRFHHVIAPAQSILDDLTHSEHLDTRRMQCIPNGVDTQRFRPATTDERHRSRESLGLTADAIVFGCVARLTEVKRHADLLEAFVTVNRQHPRSHLLLIGDGPLRHSLEVLIAHLGLEGAVELLGDRGDVERILPALDVQVLASSTEGMSNALLEAMACGLPVVATDVGGNPQLIRHSENGLLVPACDPSRLADALCELASSSVQRERMSEAARMRSERDFSLDAMAQSFHRMYQQLLSQA